MAHWASAPIEKNMRRMKKRNMKRREFIVQKYINVESLPAGRQG